MNVRENLKAYLDGELSPEEASLVAQALESDPRLRQEMEEMSKLSNALKAFAKEFQPQGYEQTVEAVVAKSRPGLLAGWRAWAVGVPAVLLVLFIASRVVRPQTDLAESAGSAMAVPSAASPSSEMTKQPAAGRGMADMQAGESGNVAAKSEEKAMAGAPSEAEAPPTMSQGADATSYLNTRQLIKNGDLTVQVEDVKTASNEAIRIAKKYSGFVESSSVSSQPNNRTAYLTLRVDSNRFDLAFTELGSIGEVLNESTSGQDVTAQVADLAARSKVKRAEEEQYTELLKSAKTIGQVLEVKDRLARVREEIESTDAQIKALRNLASLSTINLNLQQKPTNEKQVPQDWAGQTWTKALNLLSDFGKFLAQIGIVVAAFSPVWIPVALIVWWLRRRAKAKAG